jgi:hypothetical protein
MIPQKNTPDIVSPFYKLHAKKQTVKHEKGLRARRAKGSGFDISPTRLEQPKVDRGGYVRGEKDKDTPGNQELAIMIRTTNPTTTAMTYASCLACRFFA